jgi:DNA-directed RNA polymerase subunit RPC12/RpoP
MATTDASTRCDHIVTVEGEYRVMRCTDCGKLVIYRVLDRTGVDTTKMKKVLEIDLPKEQ